MAEPKWKGKTLDQWMEARIDAGADKKKQNKLAGDEHAAFSKEAVYNQTINVDPVTGAILAGSMPILEPAWQTAKFGAREYLGNEQLVPHGMMTGALHQMLVKPLAQKIAGGMDPGGAQNASDVNLFGNIPKVAMGAYEGYIEALKAKYKVDDPTARGMLSKLLLQNARTSPLADTAAVKRRS